MTNTSSLHGAKVVLEGAISEGTLRTYDLLSTFAAELRSLLPFNGASLANQAEEFCQHYRETGEWGEDEPTWLVEELQDALDEIAGRDGFWFGAHEGDGACFGFWKNEEEDSSPQSASSRGF